MKRAPQAIRLSFPNTGGIRISPDTQWPFPMAKALGDAARNLYELVTLYYSSYESFCKHFNLLQQDG